MYSSRGGVLGGLGAKSATACIASLWIACIASLWIASKIILADLIWWFQLRLPNRQIKFPVKLSGYTVYANHLAIPN